MSEFELLQTIAELAVAFAGFTGLVSLLGSAKTATKTDPRLILARLRNLLIISLALVLFAIVPFLPMNLGWSDRWVWGSSGLFALIFYCGAVPMLYANSGERRKMKGYRPLSDVMLGILTVLIGAFIVATLLGVPETHLFFSYAGVLVTLLAQCAVQFYTILISFLEERVEPHPES